MVASSATFSIGPDIWQGATPRRIGLSGRRICVPALASFTFGGSTGEVAIFGAAFSRRSFPTGLSLIGAPPGMGEGASDFGLATGGAKGEGKGVGTGDPLEAGTLSVAGTPVPFGEIVGAT